MPNIKLSYLYRDSGNYKNFGEVIFDNPTNINLEKITRLLKPKLIDGQYFYAKDWGLPDMHFDEWNEELDHGFHEYKNLEYSNDTVNSNLSLDEFMKFIQSTNWIY